ncbi:MAG: 5-(carboxyamino)imidazole ribonucleotide mutase, partial [Eubacteriales bacterium]|nr:5-(carboxyamino)imidazole ribonucleotide mutase [Eubacteriales bacterium]
DVGVRVLSAHRTPEACAEFVQAAEAAGTKVFIAAAGLAAHLPGVVAAYTRRPVIGVPLAAGPLQGQDALYSVVQMPPGVPVAAVGIDNSRNAALLAAEMLALSDSNIDAALVQYRRRQTETVLNKDEQLQAKLGAE